MSEVEIIDAPDAATPEAHGLTAPRLKDIGWLLVGGGVVGSLVTLARRRRQPGHWLIHLGLISAGASILLHRRREDMAHAQENIMAELDQLDPIARAQVLKAVAERQLGITED